MLRPSGGPAPPLRRPLSLDILQNHCPEVLGKTEISLSICIWSLQ